MKIHCDVFFHSPFISSHTVDAQHCFVFPHHPLPVLRTRSCLTWSAGRSRWLELPRKTRRFRWTVHYWADAGFWSSRSWACRLWARYCAGPWIHSDWLCYRTTVRGQDTLQSKCVCVSVCEYTLLSLHVWNSIWHLNNISAWPLVGCRDVLRLLIIPHLGVLLAEAGLQAPPFLSNSLSASVCVCYVGLKRHSWQASRSECHVFGRSISMEPPQ